MGSKTQRLGGESGCGDGEWEVDERVERSSSGATEWEVSPRRTDSTGRSVLGKLKKMRSRRSQPLAHSEVDWVGDDFASESTPSPNEKAGSPTWNHSGLHASEFGSSDEGELFEEDPFGAVAVGVGVGEGGDEPREKTSSKSKLKRVFAKSKSTRVNVGAPETNHVGKKMSPSFRLKGLLRSKSTSDVNVYYDGIVPV